MNMGKPKIRFKGYTEDWEQRKLSNTLISLQNNTLSRADLSNETGVAKNVHYGDVLIKFGEVLDVSKVQLPMIPDESVLTKYRASFLQNGDVIVADTAEDTTVGKCSEIAGLNNEIVVSGLHTIPYRPVEKFASGYLGYYLNSSAYHNQLIPLMQGIKVTSISKSAMQDTDIAYPKSVEEQGKIGTYFRSLDHLITLHQRKILYGHEKVALVWEQRKLGEIYGLIGNAFVGTATPYYVEQGHFYLESNNVKDGQINYNSEIFINDEFYEKQKDKWLHIGDMVMVQSGHVGHAAVIPEELDNTAAHALIMFRNPKEEIEPYFLNYEYQTDKAKKKIENITTGNTIKHILASDMQEFVVDVPKYEEQKVIAGYFSNLDYLITLHHRKPYVLVEIQVFVWEQRKLSECAGFRRGSFPQPYGNKDWYDGEGAMPFVQVADVASDMQLVEDTKQKISKLAQAMSVFAEKGSVLVTLQGSIGRVAITQYGAFVDRTVLRNL